MTRGVGCALWLALVLTPLAAEGARWYEDYQRAVDLIAGGECSREALQLLGAAVVDKPRPRMKARTIAVKNIDYLPYYQLARAHLACGDLDSARHYLGISRDRGVAPAALLDAVEHQMANFAHRPATEAIPEIDAGELAARVREINDTVRQARILAAQLDGRRDEGHLRNFFASSSSRLDDAAAQLSGAEEALAEGTLKRDRMLIERAATSANAALETYSDLVDGMSAADRTPPTATPPALRPPTATPAALPPTPTATVAPPPFPQAQDVSRPVSVALRGAASDYLAAAHKRVVEVFDPAALPVPRERAAGYLIRAAARFALYCLDGRHDQAQLDQVRRDLEKSHQMDAGVQPQTAVFSPELVELYRSVNGLD